MSVIRLLIVALLLAAAPEVGAYGDCTDETDCLCDRSAIVRDERLLFCEDFEAITLRRDTNLGAGRYPWGPPYDNTNWSENRGNNGYWFHKFNTPSTRCAFQPGPPGSPTTPPAIQKGAACTVAAQACFAPRMWHPTNLWNGNENEEINLPRDPRAEMACISMLEDNGFNAEVDTLSAPVAPNLGSGVFDGHVSLGHRNPGCPGTSCSDRDYSGGISGEVRFGKTVFTMGITMAVAYASNVDRTGIWDDAWKHNEFQTVSGGRNHDAFLGFGQNDSVPWTGAENDQTRPLQQFAKPSSGNGKPECLAAIASATIRKGDLRCNRNGILHFRPELRSYDWASDWGPGKWACLRGYYQDLGGPGDSTIRIWFNDELLIDFEADLSWTNSGSGWTQYKLNNFSNANQKDGNGKFCNDRFGDDTCTSETTYRYEDNLVLREGEPVSCETIGFAFGTPAAMTEQSGITGGPLHADRVHH